MCPLALLTNAQLIMSEDNSPRRESLCAVLVMARVSMTYVYGVVLTWSIMFRSFLILYADRGLVMNGQPNLTLFSQLYWVIIGCNVLFKVSIWPLSHMIKGKDILQNSNRQRACMLGNMPGDFFEEHFKVKLIAVALLVLTFYGMTSIRRKINSFVAGMCPKGKMACLGRFKRNVISLKVTYWWLVWWIVVFGFGGVSDNYGRSFLSLKSQFWIWNISEIIGCEGAHFIFPFLLKLPDQENEPLFNTGFYVRKPSLEPRRPRALSGFSFETTPDPAPEPVPAAAPVPAPAAASSRFSPAPEERVRGGRFIYVRQYLP